MLHRARDVHRRWRSSLHRALVVELVLVVLDDGRNRLQHVFVAMLYRFLQIEALNGNVVVAVFEVAAHRLKFAFRISSRISSFLLISPFTAITPLSISDDRVVGLRAIE